MKKSMKAIALAVVLAAVPATAFAEGSPNAANTDYSSGAAETGSTYTYSSSNSSSGTSSSSSSYDADWNDHAGSSGTENKFTTGSVTVTITTQSGLKVSVNGAVTNQSGVTSGLIETGNSVTVAAGKAATAGLPLTVVNTISEINSGDISDIPGIDTTGLAAYGSTVAVRAEAGNLSTSLYVSSLPEDGDVKVAFYNNYTGKWSLIDAIVDPATNTVTFMAPTSGTAVVIG